MSARKWIIPGISMGNILVIITLVASVSMAFANLATTDDLEKKANVNDVVKLAQVVDGLIDKVQKSEQRNVEDALYNIRVDENTRSIRSIEKSIAELKTNTATILKILESGSN